MKNRLDMYDRLPSGMKEYLSRYGWHFSKKMCDWAVSKMKMKDESGREKNITPMSKEDVEELLKKNGITLDKDAGYDCVYVANMAISDYYKRSITDEAHLALFIKDYIDDVDGYDGMPLTRFYADCIGFGSPIMWESMI